MGKCEHEGDPKACASCAVAQEQHKSEEEMAICRTLAQIRHKILVMSGKGGVGKSSVAAYLAVQLARRRYRVGLMDVDLHGPSIARLLGLGGRVCACGEDRKIQPVRYLPNLGVVSIETLTGEKDRSTLWRGPVKGGAIRQFIADVAWGPLDALVIDSPPGTGDEPLTVVKTIPDVMALIVTMPQEIALADVRKSIHFCRRAKVTILGLVENMSGLVCPHCGRTIDLFKTRGGMETAERQNIPFLGTLPVDPEIVRHGDAGDPSILEDDRSAFTRAFNRVVDRIEARIGVAAAGR
jgi:Mrp family chromosome partitioning ATPase